MQKICFNRWHGYTKSLIRKFQLRLHKQYVFFRALHAYQSAESILRKYKFNITRNSVKKHESLLQKKKILLRGTAWRKRAEACFSAMPAARNARLARCLIKSVAIVNTSVRKPPLNIHTQNSDAQKLRYEMYSLSPSACTRASHFYQVLSDISMHFATAAKKYRNAS